MNLFTVVAFIGIVAGGVRVALLWRRNSVTCISCRRRYPQTSRDIRYIPHVGGWLCRRCTQSISVDPYLPWRLR